MIDGSPIQDDFIRTVNYDSEGCEYITFEKFDYPSYQASLGSWSDWSLKSLLAAGIDPSFPIHTGNPTRLEGIDAINDFVAVADEILDSEKTNS